MRVLCMPSMLRIIVRYVWFLVYTIHLCMLYMIAGVLGKIWPSVIHAIRHGRKTRDTGPVNNESFRTSLLTWRAYKDVIAMLYCAIVDIHVEEGGTAANPSLIGLDGVTQYHLLDFAKKGRPLVVNFGSCS